MKRVYYSLSRRERLGLFAIVVGLFSLGVAFGAITTNEWTGAVSSDAADGGNWTVGAPDEAHYILLDDGHYGNAYTNVNWGSATNHVMFWEQTANYDGTVTFTTWFPGQGTPTNFIVSSNLVINGGTWTHTDNTVLDSVERYRLWCTVGSNFTLNGTATVDVSGRGHPRYYGPGSGSGPGGSETSPGAYGGLGGTAENATYGSFLNPVNLGSGGYGTQDVSGETDGGGAVILCVGGGAIVDSTIVADGGISNVKEPYTGSGGSIYLKACSLAGSGTLRANGGHGADSASGSRVSGGGGRVAVILTEAGQDFSSFSGQFQAFGGEEPLATSYNAGAAGTVYLQDGDDVPGEGRLIVSNTVPCNVPVTTKMPVGQTWVVHDLVFGGTGILGVDAGNVLNLTNLTQALVGNGDTTPELHLTGGTILAPAAGLTLSNMVLQIDTQSCVTGSLTLDDGAVGIHRVLPQPPPGTYPEIYKFNLEVSSNLTIKAGAAIDVTGRGYASVGKGDDTGDYPGPGTKDYNPGVGDSKGYSAAHGGRGGRTPDLTNELTYGSFRMPVQLGSSATESTSPKRGGGAVILDVGNNLVVDGAIIAESEHQYVQGGSGGSIYIRARGLIGNGEIEANGHILSGSSSAWDGGGGGRVSAVLSGDNTFTGSITAYGGTKLGSGEEGGAGTVYVEENGAEWAGVLTIDNGGRDSTWSADIPPTQRDYDSDDYTAVQVVITNYGRARITADITLDSVVMQDATAVLELAGNTLNVTSFKDADSPVFVKPGDYTDNSSGNFDGVDFGGGTIVLPRGPLGTMFILK
jgi:hypothetical protein